MWRRYWPLPPLRRPTLVLAKVGKAARSCIRPLRYAPGSLRAGAFRARAAYDLLRKSTSRAFGYAEGC